MNSKSKIGKTPTAERSLDTTFYFAAQILALAVAGVLVWITIQVFLQALPALREFGLGFLTTSSWNPVNKQYGVWPLFTVRLSVRRSPY